MHWQIRMDNRSQVRCVRAYRLKRNLHVRRELYGTRPSVSREGARHQGRTERAIGRLSKRCERQSCPEIQVSVTCHCQVHASFPDVDVHELPRHHKVVLNVAPGCFEVIPIPIIRQWAVRWGAMSPSRYLQGKDKKTPYQRRTGRAFTLPILSGSSSPLRSRTRTRPTFH